MPARPSSFSTSSPAGWDPSEAGGGGGGGGSAPETISESASAGVVASYTIEDATASTKSGPMTFAGGMFDEWNLHQNYDGSNDSTPSVIEEGAGSDHNEFKMTSLLAGSHTNRAIIHGQNDEAGRAIVNGLHIFKYAVGDFDINIEYSLDDTSGGVTFTRAVGLMAGNPIASLPGTNFGSACMGIVAGEAASGTANSNHSYYIFTGGGGGSTASGYSRGYQYYRDATVYPNLATSVRVKRWIRMARDKNGVKFYVGTDGASWTEIDGGTNWGDMGGSVCRVGVAFGGWDGIGGTWYVHEVNMTYTEST